MTSSSPPQVPATAPRRRLRRDYTVQQETYRPAVQALDAALRFGRKLGVVKLDADRVLREARRRTGLSDWGDEAFIPRMRKLVDTANELDISGLGTFSAQQTFIQAVENRLHIERYIRAHPEVEDLPIERPVFILGFPRTGTTLLQNLLSLAPGHRELRFWELTSPVPLHDDPERDLRVRRRKAQNIIRLAYFIAPEQRHIHAIRVDSAEECWPLFFNEFAVMNYDLVAQFDDFGDWLLNTDMTEPYRYYRRSLQLLAHQQPTTQFLLKCPEHLWFLDALTTVFPDACVVWTHRDPVASTASYSSLSSLGYRMIHGRIHHHKIGEHTAQRFSQGVARAMEARDRLGEDRFFDVNFKDLVRDPISMVRRIRGHFGLHQPPGSEEAMAAFLARKRSDSRGAHVYSPSQWGLDPDRVRSMFTDYIDRFDISLENKR